MASYHNFLILVCLVAANLSGCLFLGKQVVVSFVESAIILHCVKLNFWATPGKAGLIFYSSRFLCYSNIKTTKMIPSTSTKKTGLLMFRAVAEPQNSGKSAKSRKIRWKSYQIHVCTYFETCLSYWVTCRKLANSCQNFVTETCKQRSETTRRRLCCEKLGTSHDVKGFAIGSFLERIVVERANDVLC